ncbi:MAG: glycoside hydrolase family 43 protein [Clostridia bacterium]|nr:glycoside hydrolase family 43 protein [Clostridia bacterium]
MKKLLSILLLLFVLLGCSEEFPEETGIIELENNTSTVGYSYQNKITGDAADPFILEYAGTYYLYSTGSTALYVRTSKDLVNWTKQDEPIFRLSSDTSWAKHKAWAPEVYEYEGKFYLIFSAEGHNGIHSVELAVCDTPNGAFKPVKGGRNAFYSPEYSVIDGSLFFDDDGRVYMYYSKDCSTNKIGEKNVSQSYGIELKPDLSGTIGEPVLISTPEKPWELKSGSWLWNEGPVVFKANGIYYLLYSANYYQSEHYSVGYATSDSPLKKFEKSDDACILKGNGKTVTGPGHCNILRSPKDNEIYVVYHVHTVPPNTDNGRSLAMDRLIINKDGTLRIDGPSEIRRPLPSGVFGFTHITDGFTSTKDTSVLFDGIAESDTEVLVIDNGEIEFKFDTPKDLYAVMIYSVQNDIYTSERVDVEINGKYAINDCGQIMYQDQFALAGLSNMPEGEKVETLKIKVSTSGKAALSEIVFIEK